LFLGVAAFAVGLYAVDVYATWQHTKKRQKTFGHLELPPLTLIKPVKGLEQELAENLRSFFEQEYPAPVQIVFSSTEPDDPAIDLAKRLATEYPKTDVAFTVSDPAFGLNPKVANMQGALALARYDTVLQTDANMRFKPGFLKRLVSEFVGEEASLLGCLVGGVGERTAWAALENLQLTAYLGPAMCGSKLVGTTCIVCKTMLFRRSELEQLGGFALVKDLLCEDHVLGQTYCEAGKKVVLSPLMAENINVRMPLKSFFKRHARWLKMTAIIHKGGFVGQLLLNPLPFALLAWVTSGFKWPLFILVAVFVLLKTLADALLVKRMRGHGMRPVYWCLSPVRDLAAAAIWLYALFSRTTEWRGKHFRLGPKTRILPS
jgi:ceramide glucosyltransferase